MVKFLWRGVVSTSPNSQAGRQPLVGCPRLLIQYIPSYPPFRHMKLPLYIPDRRIHLNPEKVQRETAIIPVVRRRESRYNLNIAHRVHYFLQLCFKWVHIWHLAAITPSRSQTPLPPLATQWPHPDHSATLAAIGWTWNTTMVKLCVESSTALRWCVVGKGCPSVLPPPPPPHLHHV